MSSVHIRWLTRRDLPRVLDIEAASFEYAWIEEEFVACLRERNCIGMVAEHGETIAGFMVYELHKYKLHVLNFAVAPSWRRRGVGRQLVEKLASKLSSHRRTIALDAYRMELWFYQTQTLARRLHADRVAEAR